MKGRETTMEEYTEITLDNGATLRLVDVPTMLTMDAMGHYPGLSYPEPPGPVNYPTVTGTNESREAHAGDASYDEWKAKSDEVDEKRNRFLQDFPWQEGVISWKMTDGKKFVSQPPKGWEIPERYVKYGAKFSELLDTRKLAYLRYVVCSSIQNYNEIWRLINRGMLITQSEVDEAVETFQGDEEPPTVA